MVPVLAKHWLRRIHKTPAWGGFAFLFTRNTARHSQCPLIRKKIYLHIMHIYAFTVLTDIATIVYNNGARRTEPSLNIGIAWLCRTVLRILLSKLGERINIHFAVMRSILRNSYQKPSWTWHKTRLRSNTIYEFAAQFTNANYMVANRYSFKPTSNNQKDGTSNEKKHEHQPDKNKHDQQIHYRGKLRRIVEPLEVGAFRYIHAIPQCKLQ